ncbi:MAG TPA: SPFH domain-containing protein [archaeon]|nr:SPFH domain-containing protein [archaeon]
MASKNFRYIIFFILIVLAVFLISTAIQYSDLLLANLFWLALLGIVALIVWKYDMILQLVDYQRAIIYRFGKVHRVGGPGWAFVWPIIEEVDLVDLRTKTIDVPKQDVVTKDGIEVSIDAIIYLKIKKDNQSVVNSVIEVEDYVGASQLLVVSTLRDVIGSMNLGEVISSIELVNAQLKETLEKTSKNWGVMVDSVEIKDIQIPDTVLNAMHEEKAAVQQKLARMERALAHKAEIEAVKEAAKGLDENALAYYYIRAIENMSKTKGSKVFFPAEFSNLAQSISNSGMLSNKEKSSLVQKNEYYKELLKKYVDTAAKKAKSKEKSKKKKLKK